MSFLYNKPLSIEEIFSLYDKNGDGKISKKELKKNNISIYQGFSFTKDMTLEEFEALNSEKYKQYELANTIAFAEQQKNTHINYLRVNFGIKEGSEDDIRPGETVEDFEARLCKKAKAEKKALDERLKIFERWKD